MAQREDPIIDVDDYLMLDRNSKDARYEYLDGELRMLAGGSNYHARIIANLTGVLYGFLNEGPCTVYNSDVRLQLSESRYVHPDITVSCDPRDQEPDEMIRYPRVVVEVLSPSTESIDKIKKLAYYREAPTIQDYIMVDSQSVHVEIHHREEDGWRMRTYGPGSTIRVESLNISFSIDALYRGMKLTGSRNDKSDKF